MPDKAFKTIQFDLASTEPEIPYMDEHGRFFDFHSLKHQSASLYAANPENSETVRQNLTHHKTPAMARRYSHTQEAAMRRAVKSLPDLNQPSRKVNAG